MTKAIENNFTKYSFTQEELITAATLSELQEHFIQTLRADALDEKMRIAWNPESEHPDREFQLTHEYLRGQVEAFSMLLDYSKNNQSKLAELAMKQQRAQEGTT